ncbi:MAG: restriction endonuclease subunit S, partial [Nocardioides sp.]
MGETLRLEDACSELVDCVNRTAPETSEGGFFAVGTPAMRGNIINLAEARELSGETFRIWTRRLVPEEGDLLLAREAPVGPVVRIPSGGRLAAGQRTMHLRADGAVIDSRFMFYVLTSPRVQQELMALAMGSTVPHLRVADVKAFRLPVLPDLHQQRAIAGVLGALDDKIAVNDRVATSGDELAAALTLDAFSDEVVSLSAVASVTM